MNQIPCDIFAILNSVNNAAFVTDENHTIVFWSRLLSDYSKIDSSAVIGRNLFDYFPNLQNQRFQQRIKLVLEDGIPQSFSSQLNTYIIPCMLSDGSFRIQHTTVTRFAIANNDVFLVYSIKDITEESKQIIKLRELRNSALEQINERIKTEEKLRELNASKDRFFSIISHDLKNPLGALLGFVQILKDDLETLSMDEIRQFVDSIDEISGNINELTLMLLDWSRTQLKNALPQFESLDLEDLVGALYPLYAPLASRKGIKLTLAIVPEMTVFADKNMLLTVFRNLISNAIKFTRNEGEISIRGRVEAGNTIVEIADNGVGMEPIDVKNLFRLDKTVSRRGTNNETGTGLGLLLCKEFVEINNGNISVASSVGNGTTFTLKFKQHVGTVS